MASGLGAALAGCADVGRTAAPRVGFAKAYGLDAFKPLNLSPDNLSRITVCTRPFRPAGPRLEAESFKGKTIVHNYGHGGSGWSLAWGYAEEVRRRIAAEGPKSVAVLGAGAIGLTSAIAIAETGIQVTIFARDLPLESRSAYATGVWSPSSRIGLAQAAGPDFPARWEALARQSYARHLQYVGRAGSPVEFTPRFYVRTPAPEPPATQAPSGTDDFLHLDRRLRGMIPAWSEQEQHPFPTTSGVRGGLEMTFNITEYSRQLTDDFLALSGRIEKVEIGSLDELAELPGDIAVNCAGFDAKVLAGDATLIPVRGQIAWMPPQTDRLYGVYHRNVTALSRRDGVLIQETGGNEHFGLGDDSVAPSQEEFLRARAKVAPIFEWK
ncbi:MAG: FAD-dependent oxidoreductase [Pseudomonadota bacterium]